MDPNYKIFTDKLTNKERSSITELREDKKFILKKSDKEGGCVIMDKWYYINHIVIKDHLINAINKPIPSNTDQKSF